jgi:AraC-like DNA-binding protein
MIPFSRLQDLAAELRRHAPQWASRLVQAKTEHELMEVVSKLFRLSLALSPAHNPPRKQKVLSKKIAEFIADNLEKGLTLKILAQHLGYSEKYCSDLFQSTMGESFSRYLRRRRTDTAAALLRTTDRSVAEIASSLGFSDQFAFSRFFKRTTGQSPRDFRSTRARRLPFQARFPPLRETAPTSPRLLDLPKPEN